MVSCVLPTYKEEKYIIEMITALSQQTMWKYTELVVADYDPEKSKTTINAMLDGLDQKILDKIRHVAVPKSGVGIARHMGCVAAKGFYIVTVDADMEYGRTDGIERMLEPLYGGKYVMSHCYNSIKPKEITSPKIEEANKMYHWRNTIINPVSPVLPFEQGMTFRKDAYMQAGGFPDVIVGEGPLLAMQFVLTFTVQRIIQMPHVMVYSSARRAAGSGGGVILDLNYNNAYR